MSDETSAGNHHLYRFDNITVDCRSFRVQKAGQDVSLTPRAFDVLVLFLRNCGQVVDKQKLFEQVWKKTFVSDNALTKIIKEI
jgi:DNA-binding winged helix-turn-helix (wHTH) protein